MFPHNQSCEESQLQSSSRLESYDMMNDIDGSFIEKDMLTYRSRATTVRDDAPSEFNESCFSNRSKLQKLQNMAS